LGTARIHEIAARKEQRKQKKSFHTKSFQKLKKNKIIMKK
jgi:hypothetical protein